MDVAEQDSGLAAALQLAADLGYYNRERKNDPVVEKDYLQAVDQLT
jgi:hypothetical protein